MANSEPYGFIYITTNLVNGMKYLGQKRFDSGKNWKTYLGSGKYFKRAVKEYGEENFERKIICICNTEEELNQAEYDLSVFLNVVESDDWYNLKYGGETMSGYHHTEESRKKMSLIHVGREPCNKGIHMSEDTKQKESETMKRKWNDEEYRKKTTESHIGKSPSEETRRKMSQAKNGENNYWYGKKGKETPMYGKCHSNETKQKICESQPNKKKVYCLETQTSYNSINDAARELGIDRRHISDVCRGDRNSHKGYHFTFAESEVIT